MSNKPLQPIWTTPSVQGQISQNTSNEQVVLHYANTGGAADPIGNLAVTAVRQSDGATVWETGWLGAPITAPLPLQLADCQMFVVGNNLIIPGGQVINGVHTNTNFHATIAGGTIGSWQQQVNAAPTVTVPGVTGSLPLSISCYAACVVTIGSTPFLYLAGGVDDSGTLRPEVWYAQVYSDGTLGAFQRGPNLPNGGVAYGSLCVNYNATFTAIIMTGGATGVGATGGVLGAVPQHFVNASVLNNDGSLVGWSVTSTAFVHSRMGHSSVALNGQVWLFGGYDGSVYRNDVEHGALDAGDNHVTAWATSANTMATGMWAHGMAITPAPAGTYNAYAYLVGGANASGNMLATQICGIRADGTDIGTFATSGITNIASGFARGGCASTASHGQTWLAIAGGTSKLSQSALTTGSGDIVTGGWYNGPQTASITQSVFGGVSIVANPNGSEDITLTYALPVTPVTTTSQFCSGTAGTTTLNVSAGGLFVGQLLLIASGTARQEYASVAASAGPFIYTLTRNLQFGHSNDTVVLGAWAPTIGDEIELTADVTGLYSATAGATSQPAVLQFANPPSITGLNANLSSGTFTTGQPTIGFSFDPGTGGGPEQSWRILVQDAILNTQYDTGTVLGTANQVLASPFVTPIASGATYSVTATTTSTDTPMPGSTNSVTASGTFTGGSGLVVAAVPTLVVSVDNSRGAFLATITNATGNAVTTANRIYYRASGTLPWTLLRNVTTVPAVGVPNTLTLMDAPLPLGLPFNTALDFCATSLASTNAESALGASGATQYAKVLTPLTGGLGAYSAVVHVAGSGPTHYAPFIADPVKLTKAVDSVTELMFNQAAPSTRYGVANYSTIEATVMFFSVASAQAWTSVIAQAQTTGSAVIWRDALGGVYACSVQASQDGPTYVPPLFEQFGVKLTQVAYTFVP